MEFLKLRLIVVFLASIILAGCNKYVVLKPKFSHHGNIPHSPTNRFRWEVCIRILQNAYKDTKAFEEIQKKDEIIHPTDVTYSDAYYKAIDSISASFLYNAPTATYIRGMEKIDPKFLYGNKTEKQLEDQKKDYFIFAVLNFYESRELDSLARHYMEISNKEYRQYLKRLKKTK